MQLSFQHATPDAGNESLLLRVDTLGSPTQCLLIDAGEGLDLDRLLDDDDRLVGICLTHAHADHYAQLSTAHDDARASIGDDTAVSITDDTTSDLHGKQPAVPVLTSPGTAAILDSVLDTAANETDIRHGDTLRNAVTPVDDWTRLSEAIEIRPVPVGHTPGAVGFLIRVTDGDDTRLLFATGDWTLRDTAGNPGLPVADLPAVDVLFLTAATAEEAPETLTEVLASALDRARGGAPTLVTASGLTSVHLAVLLDNAVRGFDLSVPVRLAGHAATLFDQLSLSAVAPTVELTPEFDSAGQCLDPGAITLAGPDAPRENSSGVLFDALAGNPNACVIQVLGSNNDPVTDAACTISDYRLSNHPPEAALETVVDAVTPHHTVITHRRDGAVAQFNYLDTMVWAGTTDERLRLYDGNHWVMPPWTEQHVLRTDQWRGANTDGSEFDVAVPTPGTEVVSLAAEGVDVERLETTLHREYTQPTVEQNVSQQAAEESTPQRAPDEDVSPQTASESERANEKPDAVQTAEGAAGTTTPEQSTATVVNGHSSTSGTTAGGETSPTRRTHGRDDEDSSEPVVSPIVTSLVPMLVERDDWDGNHPDESVLSTVVSDATDTYLTALLAGTATGDRTELLDVEVTLSEALAAALAELGVADESALVERVLEDVLAGDASTEMEIDGTLDTGELTVEDAAFVTQGVEAVVENDEYAHQSPADVIEAAVLWSVVHGRQSTARSRGVLGNSERL